jgi:hypothetical protein
MGRTVTISITQAEILEEIIGASQAPEDAMTMEEIADAARCSRAKVRNDIAKLSRVGRILVHRVVRRKVDGNSQIVPAYTIAPKRGKK